MPKPKNPPKTVMTVLITMIFLMVAQFASGLAPECAVSLKDEAGGIHAVMENCNNTGTFSLGGIYEGSWEKLTYMYPEPWRGTFISVKVGDTVYVNSVLPEKGIRMDGYATGPVTIRDGRITVSWKLPEGLLVEESLEPVDNYTLITLNLTNTNPSTELNVGARIHIDTMLGDNDGAPIYVPGDGLRETEKEYSCPAMNFKYWKAYNRADSPNIVATGILSGEFTYPDRLYITNWKASSKTAWDYPVDVKAPITGDSAVILYFDQGPVGAGKTREIVTGYGSGEPVLKNDSAIAEIILDNITGEYCTGDEVGIKVDVGSQTGFEGSLGIEVENTAGEIVYRDRRDVSIEPDTIESVQFSYDIPGNTTLEEYTLTAKLYDKDGAQKDEEKTLFSVDPGRCGVIFEEPEEMDWGLIILLALIALILLALIATRREKQEDPAEKVSVVKVKDGINVSVTVTNYSNTPLKNCRIEDRIIEGAEVDISTIHVKRKGTMLLLKVGTLEPGETATLEYRIKNVNVVPKVVFKWDGGEKSSS